MNPDKSSSNLSLTPVKPKLRDNISTIFLLPCLQIHNQVKLQFYRMGFVNTYMYFDKVDYSERFTPLFLLFQVPDFDIDFYKFMLLLEANPNFVETLDYPGNKVLFVFKIPKKYKEDYETFKEGKYSKLSRDFKSNFAMKVYKIDGSGKVIKDPIDGRPMMEDSLFYHIFNRTDYLKEIYRRNLAGDDGDIELPDELYDRYKEEEETLIIN